MKLEQIYETLKEFTEKEDELISSWPCDSDYNVPTWDKIYDALEIIDSIINYEPSDAELEAYNSSYSEVHLMVGGLYNA